MPENPVANFKDNPIPEQLSPQLIKNRFNKAIALSGNILRSDIFVFKKGVGYKSKEILNDQTNIGRTTICAFDLMSYINPELEELGRIKSPAKEVYSNMIAFLVKAGKISNTGKIQEFPEYHLLNRIFLRHADKRGLSKEIEKYKQIPLEKKITTINDFIEYVTRTLEFVKVAREDYVSVKAKAAIDKLAVSFTLAKSLYTDNSSETIKILEALRQ